MSISEISKLLLNVGIGLSSTLLQLAEVFQTYIAVFVGILTAIYLVFQIIKISRDLKNKSKKQ